MHVQLYKVALSHIYTNMTFRLFTQTAPTGGGGYLPARSHIPSGETYFQTTYAYTLDQNIQRVIIVCLSSLAYNSSSIPCPRLDMSIFTHLRSPTCYDQM